MAKREAAAFMARVRHHAHAPGPVPEGRVEQLAYGLALPFLGLRVMLRDPELRSDAILPAACLLAWCALAASFASATGPIDALPLVGPVAGWLLRFFAAMIALAPIPSIVFVRHYARMAAKARNTLGLGPRAPYQRGLGAAFKEAVLKVSAIALGILPLVLLGELLPAVGKAIVGIVGAVWTLHWIAVEALDGARTLAPGDTVKASELREAAAARTVWFGRIYKVEVGGQWAPLLAPVRAFGRLVAWLGRSWSGELEVLEGRPPLAVGFALGVGVLLGIPGLNLLLRPAVTIAAANLLGQLERAEQPPALAEAAATEPDPLAKPSEPPAREP